MIKVNLLDSITDRSVGVAFVEDKVSNARTQTFLVALTVMALLILGVGYDYVSTNRKHQDAVQELDRQTRINNQMNAVKKEQGELEKKIADINLRVQAIQTLRASQQGPSTVLEEIKLRFDGVPGLYLKSVEQKENEIVIKGLSPNEAAVTRFGQSMEFSSGLFSNLNIETVREALTVKNEGSSSSTTSAAAADATLPAPEVVAFTIKATYGSNNKKEQSSTPAPNANGQVAKK
ncbi:MAG TPA: PilN domain-containing protein [Pyrinomonadaceae bacterium]|nr:PilN domain-containing protein [Pyrinomonadaceae bacterium]